MNYQSTINIRNLTLNGRIVMPPMATGKSSKEGVISDELIEYYRERAEKSKFGLIITEHAFVSEQGRASQGQMSVDEKAGISQMKKLADAVHAYDVKIMAQINHAGASHPKDELGGNPVAPSAICRPYAKEGTPIPTPMTKEMIAQVAKDFAAAALRVKEAGFDGVEIHAAHGYLLNQFYSPLMNKREDEYGRQNMENASRIHREVISAVREAVGEDFPVAIRVGGVDYDIEGGSTLEDCVELCKILEKAGVDMLDMTGGMTGYGRKGHTEEGWFKDMTLAVKNAVSIPVLLTGGVVSLNGTEALLEEGVCDLVGIGRASYKSALWFEAQE